MTHEEQIEEILIEAHAHGLRLEVWSGQEKKWKKSRLEEWMNELAYREWVK